VNRSAQRPDGSFDYTPMLTRFAALAATVDVAVCHLEQPLARPGEPVLVEPPLLVSAPSLATALRRGGFDRCSTASNHAVDDGLPGLVGTLDTLDAAGLGHAGTARNPAESEASLFEVNGITVAQLAYTFGTKRGLPSSERWRVNVSEASSIVAAARRARARGAEVVVLTIEWGADKISQVTLDQRRMADAITTSGAIDLIVGHQAHVLQPISQVHGVWVVWGLGNVLSDHPVDDTWPISSQDGALAAIDLEVAANGRVLVRPPKIYPTWCDRRGGHIVYPTAAMNDTSLPAGIRAELRASAQRTRSVMGAFVVSGA
jgi:poly-gamma-glutamate synthesis protein (capsule biosynthesis protein)